MLFFIPAGSERLQHLSGFGRHFKCHINKKCCYLLTIGVAVKHW